MTQLIQFTITGIVLGSIYAIAAGGLVLTYTTTGIFNFAHGAVGGLAAFATWFIVDVTGLPTIVAGLIVVILSPIVGIGLEAGIFRRFRRAPVETTLVITIALTLFLIGITNQLFDPTEARRLDSLFGDHSVRIFSVELTADDLAILVVAIGVAVLLRVLLYRTRVGVTMRAVVDSPDLAGYAGANATRIAQASWATGFALAGLSGVLFAAGRPLQILVLSFLVLNAYAAAIVGRLRSLPMTFAGAIALGVLQELSNVSWLYPSGEFWGRARLAIPGAFLLVVVVTVPQSRLRASRAAGRREPRPPAFRTTLGIAAAGVAGVALMTTVLSENNQTLLSRGLMFGVVLLSFVIVNGWGGQISLATFVFMALGAWAAGDLVGGPNPLGLLVAALICAPIGALAAIPALRLQGLYLALTSFAFALVAQYVIVGDTRIFGSGSIQVKRPEAFGIGGSAAGFAITCAIIFAGIAVGALVLRRSRFGRVLSAVRDSEAAAATLGLDIRTPKIIVCSIGAAVAGVGGVLFGAQSVIVGDLNFDPINNLIIFMFAVIGGVTTVTGALIGGALYAILLEVQVTNPSLAGLTFALVGAGAVALGRQPNGLAGVLAEAAAKVRARRPSVEAGAATAAEVAA